MRKWIAMSLMENLVETDWTKTNLPLRFKLHLGYRPQQKNANDFPERFNTKSLAVLDYSPNRSTDAMLRYFGYKLERQGSTKKISTSEKLRR